MSESDQVPPSEMPTGDDVESNSSKKGVATGATIAGGGCLALGFGGLFLTISLLTVLGDMMSGGQVPGHGQGEIDSSLAGLGGTSGLLTIGFLALIGGVIYAVYKGTSKKE